MRNYKNDIEKYLKGELSPSEMHALEMEVLHDPFLADALEGAESISPTEFERDVKSINQKIKVNPPIQYIWPIGIAASLIFLISITYFVFLKNPVPTEPLALAEKDQTAEQVPEVLQNDEIVEEDQTKSTSPKTSEIQKLDKATARTEASKTVVTETDRTSTASGASQATNARDSELIAEVQDSEREAEEGIGFSEDLSLDEVDLSENKRKSAKKSSAPLPAQLSTDRALSNEIEVHKSESIVDQPSVTEYQKYLKDNVQYPRSALANQIEGVVTVRFKVNADSTLSDFKIIKGIGHGCDEELIRLIKAGPAWVPGNRVNQTNEVTLEFKIQN